MSEATSAEEIPFYDVNIWKTQVFDFASMEAFVAAPLPSEGIVRIGEGFGKVEFKLEGGGGEAKQNYFLVAFSGAILSRATITAPLFSGVGLSRSLEMPLLAFADPVVSASPAVCLGWYAGGKGGVGHSRNVAWVIDHVARITGRTPILIGGSGGGFAAISAMRYMAVPARGFVWNPQTVIAHYEPEFVRNYIKVAFPDAHGDNTFSETLANAKVDQDVCSASYGAPSCLVYLQSDSDHHHIQEHMKPFMRLGQWRDHNESTTISHDRRIIVRTGDWGEGHAVPPKHLIEAMIRLLGQDDPHLDPWDTVLRGLPDVMNITSPKAPEYDLDARANLQEGEVSITIDVSRLPSGLSYAYYLMEDGVRAASQWYSSNPAAKFQTTIANTSRLTAVVFARSGQDAPTIRNINVESVDRRP